MGVTENRSRWVARLRDPESKQFRGRLRERGGDAMCCLGHLCEVFRLETGRGEWDEHSGAFTIPGNEGGVSRPEAFCTTHPPAEVARWAGLAGDNGPVQDPSAGKFSVGGTMAWCLADANDNGATLEQIADVIEAGLV